MSLREAGLLGRPGSVAVAVWRKYFFHSSAVMPPVHWPVLKCSAEVAPIPKVACSVL